MDTVIQVAGHTAIGETDTPCIIPGSQPSKIRKLVIRNKGEGEAIFYRAVTSLYGRDQSSRHDSGCSSSSETENTEIPKVQLPIVEEDEAYLSRESDIRISQFEMSIDLLRTFCEELLPRYYGIYRIDCHNYLELSKVGWQLSRPCITDVKIGKSIRAPTASAEKSARMLDKYPNVPLLGYQFLGIYKNGNTLPRDYFRWQPLSQMTEVYNKFLPTEQPLRRTVVTLLNQKLSSIIDWFEKQTSCQFYSSSLLIVYSLDTGDLELKMIDFAHVFYEADKRDDNYLYGIRNLSKHLEMMVPLDAEFVI